MTLEQKLHHLTQTIAAEVAKLDLKFVDTPWWFPLRVSSASRYNVLDADGSLFAQTHTLENAALIVLTMNASVRRDFDVDERVTQPLPQRDPAPE